MSIVLKNKRLFYIVCQEKMGINTPRISSNNESNTAYSATTQSDIMYRFARGAVSQTGNALAFPTEVGMRFYHALALINFQIKAGDEASRDIQIYKIELNGARYTGDLTITNTNAATEAATWSAEVDWTFWLHFLPILQRGERDWK